MSSPSFYSSAGNFIDAVQGGVDPRTGLFNVSLPLMNLLSGDLAGPGLALGLSYSPLSQKDEGFGTGFTFNLTRYDIPSRRLVLSTGEEYSISPSGEAVYQKKLKSFIFNKTDEDSYQIIYKSGLVEQLIKYNSVFVTTLITAPCGRHLSFDWDASARLVRVRNDDNTVLCQITYASESVISTKLSVLPDDPGAHYDILFNYANGYINSVILPTDDAPLTWGFGYETDSTETHNQWVITHVSYPTGAREQVLYDFSGMSFPDAAKLAALPRVTQHTFSPGGEQPPVLTKWEWTKENYLGKNLDRTRWVWDTDPLLEHLSAIYRYGSTEKIIASDGINVLRSVMRRYNSYHLLISERALRDGKIYQRITDYHAQSDVSYDEQPAQYLLPVSLKELWDDGTGKPVRSFFTYWKYDTEGNLLREERPDGSITECVYYPAGGEKGCPPDPHGFTRYLKNMTVTPRRLKGDESATVSVHTWQSLGTGDSSYVVPSRVVETTGNMQIDVNRIYNNSRKDRLTFGREHKRITSLTPDIKAGTSFVRRQSFSYEIRDGRLLQSETLRTHDGLEATFSTLRHSSLGYLLSETDAHSITVNHTYDRLGRVLTRAEAVGTNYERLTLWLYAIEGSGPVSLVTDSAGNQTKTFFDGAGREIRQQRLNKDTQKWFEVSSQRYNSQGEVVFNLSSDWATKHLEQCCISTSISYDGWGNVSEQAFSDDIKNQIVTDPIELTQILCTKGETSDQTFSSGECTTVLDDKSCLPLTETLKNTEGIIQGIRHYEWDGRGFLRQETDEKKKKSTWTYDALGRVLTQTLPDGTVISRTYAPHLTENHVTSISVTGKDRAGSTRSWLLGTQVFDGLGRLTKRVTGGRTTSCTYEGASAVPSTVTLPSGKLLKYKYIPELGNVISSLTADGVTQTFSYDTATGQMVKATAGVSEIENILYPSGSVKAEAFTLNGDTKKTAYIRMLKGDVIQYTDISGKETRCERDEFGRILTINDDALSASLEYDALGRLNRQTVTDRVTKSSLTTELEYDDFGQEITRTITDSNGESLKVTQTWRQDGLLAGRITQKDGVEIRKEHYGYDLRNRLRLYRINGSSFPEDWRGHEMTTQLFEYDALNNLINVSTCLTDASLEVAVYRYENSDDPTQLTSVVRYEGKPSQTISLEYDANGCMLKDGAGHTFNYDALGRLNSVNGYNDSCSYVYDALNRLVSQNINNYPYHFYYRDGQLVSKVQTQWNAVTRLIRNGASCMGMSRSSFQTLMATDQNECVLWSHETSVKEGVLHIWAPYGSGKVTSEQPGFNGERVDPVSGVYHLGNGYRAYNPVLMRFNCPDNLSPFGAGGINPYAYCAGDPINFTDPTGHISGWGIAGIVLGAVGLIAAAAVAGIAIAAAGSIGAAISAASTTTLVVGGLSVVADVTAIASGAAEESNPEVSSALGWASLATGLPALAYGIFRGARALSGWWKAARSMPGLARGGAVSVSAARTGRALASNSMPLGDGFNLFRAAGMRASRLLISAHGEQSLMPLRTFLQANTRLRFYASDGYSLLTRLHNVAKQSVVARETISGGGLVRNYNLSRVAESYSEVQSLVRQYGVDIVTVNNTARSAFYPADMNMLLRSLQSSNISYDTIDAVICRGNWMGLNVPVQNALPA